MFPCLKSICSLRNYEKIGLHRNTTGFLGLFGEALLNRMCKPRIFFNNDHTLAKNESQEMKALWPMIVQDFTEFSRKNVPETTDWIEKMLQYNLSGGKSYRGVILIDSYKKLIPQEQLTDDKLRLARILGWCAEISHRYITLIDDIMDNSKTRRGKPCWYMHENVGLAGINDGMILEQSIYQLLKKHFRSHSNYCDIIETFHQITLEIALGQLLDLSTSNAGKKSDLTSFTTELYNAIITYKTAYCTSIRPVTLALYLACIDDQKIHKQAENVLKGIGCLYQIQDDYLDCYGNPDTIGKTSSDIQEGKCTWLITMALEHANSIQRQILNECYGSNDLEKVHKVKGVYDALEIPKLYSIHEEKCYSVINKHIREMKNLPRDLFYEILEKFYRRNI